MITDLQAATTRMGDVIGINYVPKFIEFELFLKLAEVYGSGYLDDVDYGKFNLR